MSRKLVIFDLDETMIHSSYNLLPNNKNFIRYKYLFIYLRPHVIEFVKRISQSYDVAIWTASKSDYAKFIIRNCSLKELPFIFIKTRVHCKKKSNSNGQLKYYKDLTTINDYPISEIIIFDDLPGSVHPIENTIKVTEYRGSEIDDFFIGRELTFNDNLNLFIFD
jgi:RNA polymerase II subunit A small phosphatase-like protein